MPTIDPHAMPTGQPPRKLAYHDCCLCFAQQSLSFIALAHMHFYNEDFKDLLRVMRTPLIKLHLEQTNFEKESLRILKENAMMMMSCCSHVTVLRVLNLKGCEGEDDYALDGVAIQDMLCTMPALQEFRAGVLRDTDILRDPREWVCLGMKVILEI